MLALLTFLPELLLALACFLFLYRLRRQSRHRLEPTNWPVIGMLPTIVAHLHHIHDHIARCAKENGTTFMFKGPWLMGLDFLITADPANVNHILNVNFANYPKGDDFAEIFDILGDGIFNADAESWKVQRRMAHAFFGDREFRSFAARSTRRKIEDVLLPILHRLADSGEPVEIQNVFMQLSFDVTSHLILGVDPGSLSLDSPPAPFSQAMDDTWEALFFRHVAPMRWWKLLRWLGLGKERKMAEAREVVDRFINQKIAERREELKRCSESQIRSRHDLLTWYMSQTLEESLVHGMFEPDKFLRDTTFTMMLAGRDGFATTLSWLLWLLAKNPAVEAKIVDELRAHSNMEPGSEEQLSSMVYLHGAVCETLRLFPPVPYEHKGVVAPEVLPSGHRVEKGGRILFSVYAMGRLEEIWGKDCMEFRPERWITEAGKVRHVPAYKFMVFNAGPRSCVGKGLAVMQIKTVAAAVLWNFEMEVLDGDAVVAKNAAVLRMKDGMRVRVKRRSTQL